LYKGLLNIPLIWMKRNWQKSSHPLLLRNI
jgi:hypothetical protein